jgi:hypothetical protein
MNLDPDLFTIKQMQEMGMWPPSNLVAHGISPYIARQKKDDLIVLDIGVMKGENAFMLLANDTKKKIKMIYGVISYAKENPEYEDVLKQNMKYESKFSLEQAPSKADIVCIHGQSDLYNNLHKYYDTVEPNGIFCGNEHGATHVKELLNKFRREKKIGTPISVANDTWFWYTR